MKFTKVHGLGNDFVFIDNLKGEHNREWAEVAKTVCDRHFGIGADGLVLILPSEKADFRMQIFNSDGSEAEMCGNAIRCFARHVYVNGLTDKSQIRVETLAGIMVPKLIFDSGVITGIQVDMGKPHLKREEIPMLGEAADKVVNEKLDLSGKSYGITCVSMGNPHAVIFVDDADAIELPVIGPQIEKHIVFPRKTNVEFVHVLNHQEIRMRVWERGAGETLACGTGACASTVACILNGLTDNEVKVQLAGGSLMIKWADDGHVYMTGPAKEVFSGEIDL